MGMSGDCWVFSKLSKEFRDMLDGLGVRGAWKCSGRPAASTAV